MEATMATQPFQEDKMIRRSDDIRLPGETQIGYVHLQVSNLERSLHFDETLVGMMRVRAEGNTVYLSASGSCPVLLVLWNIRGAPETARSTGLYHTAIRFPRQEGTGKSILPALQKRCCLPGVLGPSCQRGDLSCRPGWKRCRALFGSASEGMGDES